MCASASAIWPRPRELCREHLLLLFSVTGVQQVWMRVSQLDRHESKGHTLRSTRYAKDHTHVTTDLGRALGLLDVL
eukprot:4795530-Prymnesium_polylepis.2